MHSDDSNQFFVQRIRAQAQQHRERGEAPPSRDGIDVQEHVSMVTLSEEDQRLLMALRERHEMLKERSQTLPALVEDDTAYETVRVKQVVVPGV